MIGEDDLLDWMTHDRTMLCQEGDTAKKVTNKGDPQKGDTADNYLPIKCLPLIWKFLTEMIAEEIYNYLE